MDGEIKPYVRKAKYYETDQMGIIHHSNYIRWFEEARLDFLEQIGLGYDKIEAAGIFSPVLSVACEYRSSVRFNETVKIYPKLVSFNGIKMTVGYLITDVVTGQVRATGKTEHCFLTKDYKPVSLKRNYKNMYDILHRFVEAS